MSPSFKAGHALLIGVGADLPFTINDAKGVADILKDPGRCAYPPNQVELLTGDLARRQAILDALDRLAKAADESSTVLIYFSGHGYRAITPIGEAYFLIPFGVQMEHLKDTAINGSEFTSRLQAIKSKKLLLLLDCCHSGGVGLAKGLVVVKSPLPPEALQILENGKGRVIIASCKESELSYGGRPYSAFTLALIEAFSGQGASRQDGFVRAADLAMYAREKVPGRTKGKQHPILQFEEADNFVLAYYAGGEIEPKGLPFAQEPEVEPEPGAWSGVFDQGGQTVHGNQTNIAGSVEGGVASGQTIGPMAMKGTAIDMRGAHVVFHCGSLPGQSEIPDASGYILSLSMLKEWKDMHTKAHDILDKLSPAVAQLDKCRYESTRNLDEQLKSVEFQWKFGSRSLKTLVDIIEGFHYIASNDDVKCCLDHAITSANITDLISKAKTSQDAEEINIRIGAIIETFEITLMVADNKIVKLVDDFAFEFAKRR